MSVRTDIRDWYIMFHLGGVMGASTYFLFLHPEHFDGWALFVGTIISAFQWLTIHDDKVPDAINNHPDPLPPQTDSK